VPNSCSPDTKARRRADVAINYFPSEEPEVREVIQLIKDGGLTAEDFGNTTVFGRPGPPELASIYVQLAAAAASFTNGNTYGAGGGQGQP